MKRFYLMGEHICNADCPESLINCPMMRAVYDAGFDYRMDLTRENMYVYVESFRYPATTELKNELTRICSECKQRQR